MSRYFLEISYKGTGYSGFQLQENANTIQAEVEKALHILVRSSFAYPGGEEEALSLTGSSRTDSGVHARQNFFHFDTSVPIRLWRGIGDEAHLVYKLNAILPDDIVVKKLIAVAADSHCRFDAVSREYKYYIYQHKDPFLRETAFFFPYKLEMEKLQQAAAMVKEYNDFTSFSKRRTQVKSFICQIHESKWLLEEDCLVYQVKANRFLRGMVRALTATMLKIGRNKLSLEEFRSVIEARDCRKASFAVPPRGLFLLEVNFPDGYFGK
jgi:tRNA pseudouridine38-40 synthase